MTEDLWVFAYGSLMWKPGFPVAEAWRASLADYHRAFALYSIHYRGTPERPGLVLGLDWRPGARCTGIALRVAAGEADRVRRYLSERELVSRAYFEVAHEVELIDPVPVAGASPAAPRQAPAPRGGRRVLALCYVVDRTHPQYAGGLSLEQQAEIIAGAAGPSGSNREYLLNTAAHLRALGIEDPELFALERLVEARTGVTGPA